MYSCYKLARGIGKLNREIDPKRMVEYKRLGDKKLQEMIESQRRRDVWPHNKYFVNCDEPVDRACGPIYRSKK